MNVQRLIEKYKKLEGVWDAEGAELARQIFLQDLEQLDEPETVKIPQFVADVIESAREHSPELEDALHYTWGNGTKEFTEWYKKKSNRDLFARAWLDGYEIEEEKEYKVVLLNYNDGHLNLVNVRTLGENIIFFTKKTQFDPRSLKLTKTEIISSGFGWVFDCPGIQIEEVE